MKELEFVDMIAFFCKAVPAFLIALALWSLAIGFSAAICLALYATAANG